MSSLNLIKMYLSQVNWVTVGYGALVALVLIAIIILIGYVLAKRKIYNIMADAELKISVGDTIIQYIESLQISDADERLIYTVIEFTNMIPFIKWLPDRLLFKLFNGVVQRSFDKVKNLIKARTSLIKVKEEINEARLTEIQNFLKDTIEESKEVINELVKDQLKNKVSNSIKETIGVEDPIVNKVIDNISEVVDTTDVIKKIDEIDIRSIFNHD